MDELTSPSWRERSIRWSGARRETELWEQQYGSVPGWVRGLRGVIIPPMVWERCQKASPSTKALDEDAAHFLVRMVRKYPHEITIYAGGPMTNLALAISIDPEFCRAWRRNWS